MALALRASVSHSYQYGGTYEVVLAVTDVAGNVASTSHQVTVVGLRLPLTQAAHGALGSESGSGTSGSAPPPPAPAPPRRRRLGLGHRRGHHRTPVARAAIVSTSSRHLRKASW